MENAEEQDVKLERSATQYIIEIETSLTFLLWERADPQDVSSVRFSVRRLVQARRVSQLIKLLDQFQESPQLLDRHLAGFIKSLSFAFLCYLDEHAATYSRHCQRAAGSSSLPLPRAVCDILYTFCKVRGYKIISQLLNHENKHLDPMLDAFWAWNWPRTASVEGKTALHEHMEWEERYVMLLWLSQILLAPFDLVTISTPHKIEELPQPFSDALQLPSLPQVASRIIYLALHYVKSPSKEREAAGTMLVRLLLRTDMLKLNVHESIINIVLRSLEGNAVDSAGTSLYEQIGDLGIIHKFTTSADDSAMRQLHTPILETIQAISTGQEPRHAELCSSAVARKLLVKIQRAMAVAAHRMDLDNSDEILSDVVEYTLTMLGDNDTSVRFAASKAFSAIALQVGPENAGDLLEIILDSLKESFAWTELKTGKSLTYSEYERKELGSGMAESLHPDYTSVSALKWHGLVLALSHLLYRHSVPLSLIGDAVDLLILAVDFNQRSSLGSSVGANVRDAACLGFWALARKYSTEEIHRNGPHRVGRNGTHDHLLSTHQVLVNELVLAACLDPAGNIRRGASAALQETVGRHSDTITSGILLVQKVDYNAVALRSNAVVEVAEQASMLDEAYSRALLDGLFGWRGIKARDAPSRRLAAKAIGRLSVNRFSRPAKEIITRIRFTLSKCQLSQAEELHGLILSLSRVIKAMRLVKDKAEGFTDQHVEDENVTERDGNLKPCRSLGDDFQDLPTEELWVCPFDDCLNSGSPGTDPAAMRSEYIHEAVCELYIELAEMTGCGMSRPPSPKHLARCFEAIRATLLRPESSLVHLGASAEKLICRTAPASARRDMLRVLLTMDSGTILPSRRRGLAYALATIFEEVPEAPDLQERVLGALLNKIQAGNAIDLRCTALEALALVFESKGKSASSLPKPVLPATELSSPTVSDELIGTLLGCLDDYTIDERGDVGSLIRIEATKTASAALEAQLIRNAMQRQLVVAKICGLAVEKLDKVRFQAAQCLGEHWTAFGLRSPIRAHSGDYTVSDVTTIEYFLAVLDLCQADTITSAVLTKYVTSGGAGSQSLLQASREALVLHAQRLPSAQLAIFCTHLVDIVRDNTSNDRVLVSTLEVIAFMLDYGIFSRLEEDKFAWHRLLNATHKAHYKSGNLRRLEAAISVYYGLTTVPSTRADALQKLQNMLLHGMAMVRNNAADALFLATEDTDLLGVNWSSLPKELKPIVEKLRSKGSFVDIPRT